MDAQFFLEMGEQPVAVVCRLRDVELRVPLEREEPGEVRSKRSVGATESLVRVLPSSLVLIAPAALFEEFPVQDMPDVQGRTKLNLAATAQAERDASKGLCRFRLRPCGNVVLHRQDLMELAVLHENAPAQEHLPHALPPVDHRHEDGPSQGRSGIDGSGVVLHTFRANLPPVQDVFPRAADEDAVSLREEEGVEDGHDAFLPHGHFPRCPRVPVEVPSQRSGMHPVLRCEVGERVAPRGVEVVRFGDPARRGVTLTLKDRPAITAVVPLETVSATELPRLQGMASATAFFMMNFEERKRKALQILPKPKREKNINQKCPLSRDCTDWG